MNSILLSYLGVHQMFQLALAAQEAGELQRFYCSLLDAPGKWGRLLAGKIKGASLRPMGAEQLDPAKVSEIPWPLFARQMKRRLTRRSTDYYLANTWFDRRVAAKLKSASGGIFVGGETCAKDSFRVAGERGMKRVLDCHGIPTELLDAQIARAVDELGIQRPVAASSARMSRRKAEERGQADVMLLCSEMQRGYYLQCGIPESRLRVNPLWVDPLFRVTHPREVPPSGPLKVLFAGHATLAKGAPYALQAMARLAGRAQLTICGGVEETVRHWAGNRIQACQVIEWMPRSELAKVYSSHDVLLFPTLGDSFGFVAMEAMAGGLPVIATHHAGAPLPDASWRVPSHDADAIAARLDRYASDRALLAADGIRAFDFSQSFTPENFRRRAAAIFGEILRQTA